MSATTARVAVIEEAPRSVSVLDVRKSPRFLDRTSLFLRKVSPFRAVRRKSDEKDRKNSALFSRSARSMDMANKTFDMSQPMLSMGSEHSMTDNEDTPESNTTTITGSPTSTAQRKPSKAAERPSQAPNAVATPTIVAKPNFANLELHAANGNGDATPRVSAPAGLPTIPQPTPSSGKVDGLPFGETLPQAAPARAKDPTTQSPNSTQSPAQPSAPHKAQAKLSAGDEMVDDISRGSDETFHSAVDHSPTIPTANRPPVAVHRPLPTPPPSQRVKFTTLPSTNPRNPFLPLLEQSVTQASQMPSSKTPAPPPPASSSVATRSSISAPPTSPMASTMPLRLASLPPPMMARFATSGSVRLTPTLTSRPTPMPILNLPTLPLPTPRIPPPEAVTQSPARLRGMPALPLRGPSEAEDASHENAALDEMEEMDEDMDMDMDEEDMDMEGPEERTSEGSGSSPEMEVPTVGWRLRSPLPPSLSRSPGGLPPIDTSPLHMSFRTSPQTAVERPSTQFFTPTEPVPPDVLRTPVAAFRKGPTSGEASSTAVTTDYFTSKTPERQSPNPDASRTPRPGDFVPLTVPMPNASPRPGFYHQGSKSMVDLLSISRKDMELPMPAEKKQGADVVHEPVPGPSGTAVTTVKVEEQLSKSPTLRRRRSMPVYNPATEPPPYPDFLRLHAEQLIIQPREEEGREQLPSYTNSIYLAAIMPRKVEFTAPGMQAKDRKWKRALCVLEGTVFKVYRVHSGVVEDWWERTVGIGDRTSVDPFAVGAAGTIRVSGLRGTGRNEGERPTKEDAPLPNDVGNGASSSSSSSAGAAASNAVTQMKPSASRSKLHTLLHPSRGSHNKNSEPSSAGSRSRMSFDTSRDSSARGSATSTPRRRSMDISRSTVSPSGSPTSRYGRNDSMDTSSPSGMPSSSSTASRQSSTQITPATSHFSSTPSSMLLDEEPDAKDLVRAYTLQQAESGLASDYTKRKNVIRVRMEGEQFLLQARDVPGVIEWIEGIQAATNVALDLDERPMPRGPIFPRRRRRRARRPDVQGTTTNAAASHATSSSNSRPSQSR